MSRETIVLKNPAWYTPSGICCTEVRLAGSRGQPLFTLELHMFALSLEYFVSFFVGPSIKIEFFYAKNIIWMTQTKSFKNPCRFKNWMGFVGQILNKLEMLFIRGVLHCPACRTSFIATRFWVVVICPFIKCLTVLEFSFILFDLCLFITIFNFILNYVPIVTFWIFTYHKIWILLIIFCFIWNYWIIYFLTCLEVFWSVVS